MSDKINPNHYKNNPIETCDATFSQLSEAEILGACKFNIAKYIFRAGKKVQTLEGTRDDIGKAHWFVERLLKEITDMINKRKKAKRKNPTEIELEDLTEEDLQELLNPGAKKKKPSWNIEGMLKEMSEEDVIELVGSDYWNEYRRKKNPGKVVDFKKKEDHNGNTDTK